MSPQEEKQYRKAFDMGRIYGMGKTQAPVGMERMDAIVARFLLQMPNLAEYLKTVNENKKDSTK